jgi:hypothetical protein
MAYSTSGECRVCHNRQLRLDPAANEIFCAKCHAYQHTLDDSFVLCTMRMIWHKAEKHRIAEKRARTDLMRARAALRAHNIELPKCLTADADVVVDDER